MRRKTWRHGGSCCVTEPPSRQRLRAAVAEALEMRLVLSTITVNTFVDRTDPPGSAIVSLRDAIADAEAHRGPVTIDVPAGNYPLTLGQLSIDDETGELAIDAVGGAAVINGQSMDTVFGVAARTSVSLHGLTISGGKAPDPSFGGGINNAGMLTVQDCTISGNVCTLGAGGGNIYNSGHLTFMNGTITGGNGGYAGAIDNVGSMILADSTVSANSDSDAGEISNSGRMGVSDCTVSGNVGNGLFNTGHLTIVDTTISGNEGDKYGNDGIESFGTLTLDNSTVSDNAGIGILTGPGDSNHGGANSSAMIFDCTVCGNDALDDNVGGDGISGESFTLANSIVAGNTAAMGQGDVNGAVNSRGHNLIGDTTGSSGWTPTDLTGTAAHPLNPDLSPLGNFGGLMQTQVPLPSSPAIAAGSVELIPAHLVTDERGFLRVVGHAVDIGAVEVGVELHRGGDLHLTRPAPQTVTVGTAAMVTLGSFTQTAGVEPFAVIVNWGDGSPKSSYPLAGSGSLGVESHIFVKPGRLDGSITIVDSAGDLSNVARMSIESNSEARMTITVNTTADTTDQAGNGTVSLRDAIASADAGTVPFTIDFDPNVFAAAQAISLESNLQLKGNPAPISIDGPSAGVTLSGGTLIVGKSANAVLSRLTFNPDNPSDQDGIDNSGRLTLYNCTLDYCVTGIDNSGTATIEECTVAYNNGGLVNSGRMTVVESTISGNDAPEGPAPPGGFFYPIGGVANSGTLSIADSTISANTDGIANTGRFSLSNSIAAGNQDSDIYGSIKSLGHNLIGDASGISDGLKSDLTGTRADPLNPDLAPLGSYGGLTLTMPPMPGSPAIGAGSISLIPSGIITDQRGDPRIVNGAVDIGALQVDDAPIALMAPLRQQAVAGTPIHLKLGTFQEAGGDGPYAVRVHWGDGSPDTMFSVKSAGSLGTETHSFIETGLVTVAVSLVDGSGRISQNFYFPISVAPAPAKVVTVNTASNETDPAGSNTVSLSDAFNLANSALGPVTIVFDPAVFDVEQTITYTYGNGLSLSGNHFGPITVDGPSAGLVIAGGSPNFGQGVTSTASGITFTGTDSRISNVGATTLRDCTITGTGNPDISGGIYNSYTGDMTIVDCTIVGNALDGGFGEIRNTSQMTVEDSTITGNGSDGIEDVDTSSLRIGNTIVAGNSGGDVSGSVTSLGHNLIGEVDASSSGWVASDLAGTDPHPLNPDLSPLANNGGPTQTQVPLPGSPAIGAGSVALIPAGITTDQRGLPRVVDGKVDVGAVEAQPASG